MKEEMEAHKTTNQSRKMKKIAFAIWALIALAACSNDEELQRMETSGKVSASSITIAERNNDSHHPPIIGIEIGGSAYTEYTFEAGDQIRIVSEKGLNVVLTAENSGKEGIRFVGDFHPVAETDNYWAIYPATYALQADGTFHVEEYFAGQTGEDKDVALLGAHAEQVSGKELHLEFYPINTLLHVAIENAPEKFDYALLEPILPNEFVTNGTYYIDYMGSGPTFYYDDVPNYIDQIRIENPDIAGFFFDLGCGAWFGEGYKITLKAGEKVLTKRYEGERHLEPGYSYRTTLKWEESTTAGKVVCGARTSYDYYREGAISVANQMVNTAIVLGDQIELEGEIHPSGAHSTYSEIEDSEISYAGVSIRKNGALSEFDYQLPFKEGTIGYNHLSNLDFASFEWGEYTATAYLVLKNGRKIVSEGKTLHITGLPYDTKAGDYHGFYTEDERTWTDGAMESRFMKFYWCDISNGAHLVTDNTKWYGHTGVGLHAASFRWAQILSPEFHVPEAVNFNAQWGVWVLYAGVELGMELSNYQGEDSGVEVLTAKLGSGDELTQTSERNTLTPQYPCLQIEHRSAQILPSSGVSELQVLYTR